MNSVPKAAFGDGEMADGVVTGDAAEICETDFPLADIPSEGDFALAIITGVEGASYRPLGAAMVIDAAGHGWGSLSSGCLERDVVLQAQAAIAADAPRALRYGRGSRFLDIQLPCGGGLDIRILPNPDRALLGRMAGTLAARRPVSVVLGRDGRLAEAQGQRQAQGQGMLLRILPQIRFVVFGKGPEASCFAGLAQRAGYPVQLYSPDPETLAAAGFGQATTGPDWPQGLVLDPRSAVTMFFHDHHHEPALLQAALAGPAFYVGAQGSLRAHRARSEALAALGVAPADIGRLASPFGLIPSVRDARTLAVSVLADVLERAQSARRARKPAP